MFPPHKTSFKQGIWSLFFWGDLFQAVCRTPRDTPVPFYTRTSPSPTKQARTTCFQTYFDFSGLYCWPFFSECDSLTASVLSASCPLGCQKSNELHSKHRRKKSVLPTTPPGFKDEGKLFKFKIDALGVRRRPNLMDK